MSLQDAKRTLQGHLVMEALSAAGVDAETLAMVEFSRQTGDIAQSITSMLLGGADTKQAKNYVKLEMVGLAAPFERVYVELTRAGGKTSHELRELLRERLRLVRDRLAAGPPVDVLRQGIVAGIDELLAEEAP